MRLAALFTLIALPTVVATASARTWSQDWPVGAHPTLYVETTDAHVYVHRGAAGSVKAHIEYTVNVWGLHTEIREPRIQLEREGDSLTVIARPRSSVAVFGGISERFRIDVTVPPTCDVHVRSGDGGVDVEPVEGRLEVQTGDGRITVHGARGDVRLWTGDGGIDADGLDGSLVARTGDGHLQVSGRFDRMELHSGDGRVEASIQRGSRLLGPWDFTSGDGGITLRIPRNLQAVLDAATRDGSVRVDLPIDLGDQRRHHVLRGALNGGTIPLRVRTGDGSITRALSE
jgi:hypothetical protein